MAADLGTSPVDKGAPPLPPTAPRSASGQMRRAWRVLILSFGAFAILLSAIGIGFATYRANATKPRGGRVSQIISGNVAQVAQVHSRQQSFWNDLIEGSTISEGETIRTGDDTRMRVELFDHTIVDLSANTEVTFDRLRASQYIDRNATIELRQDHGRMVVESSPDTIYNRVYVDVRTRAGTIESRQPGTKFSVLVLVPQEEDPGRVDVSVLNGADVTVAGAGQRVVVATGQQTVMAGLTAPSAPSVKQRELVENGNFKIGGNIRNQLPTHWQVEENDGGDGTGIRASEEIVPETIRGQPVNALHFVRAGGNVDSDLIGLKQTLAFSELDEYDSVVLSADVKIVSHSLSGGGEYGSEYPVVFLVRYVSAKGDAIDVARAFYVQNDDNNRTATNVLQGMQVKAGIWTDGFHWELKQVYPVPYKLVGINVYASGHDYDAYVANISIVAK